jgi:MarR family transcriptional regulator, 2-MHQ and catechol-resistance regulon repressor
MSAIGKKVLLANASMTSAIDRLDERGLVIRQASRQDRRIRLVDLTPKGRALIEAVFARHEQHLEALMVDLSSTERAELHAGLKKLGLTAESALEAGKA